MDDKKMPNAMENNLVLRLMAMRDVLIRGNDAAHDRLKAIPNAWRDYKLLFSMCSKTLLRLMDTMPDKRQHYYERMAQEMQVVFTLPGPVRRDRYIMIERDDLAALTEAAMRGDCALCLRSGREIKKCRIRAALLEVATPENILDTPTSIGCEYRNLASTLMANDDMRL